MELENTQENETLGSVSEEQNEQPSALAEEAAKVIETESETVFETPAVPRPVEIVPERRSNKRILTGKVTSNKPDKTIVVKIERQVAHPLYKKYFKRTNKIMAHDENNSCGMGDLVKIKECRPLSKNKRFELLEIVERAK